MRASSLIALRAIRQLSKYRRGEDRPKPAVALPASRREQLRPLTLRIPENLHNALLYIAENSSKSMNQFAIDALTPAVEAQIAKIAKRKELGLD